MAVMEREQDLYAPVKALLEAQGYEVKGEVGAADVVAIRGGEAPVVVELKLRFSKSRAELSKTILHFAAVWGWG